MCVGCNNAPTLTNVFDGVSDGRMSGAMACMFTNTPDTHFIIDQHPGNPRVRHDSPNPLHDWAFMTSEIKFRVSFCEPEALRTRAGTFLNLLVPKIRKEAVS